MSDFYDIVSELIATVVILGLVIGVVFLLNSCSESEDTKAWNGGYHEDCGGRWEYDQAVGHRYDTDYIYVCDKCGMRHEFETYFMEVEE